MRLTHSRMRIMAWSKSLGLEPDVMWGASHSILLTILNQLAQSHEPSCAVRLPICAMADRLCQKCGAAFPYPRDLKRHLSQKKPCAGGSNNRHRSEVRLAVGGPQ